MAKARKFKKKLVPRLKKRKIESVLSVEFIRKETLEKVRSLFKRIFELTMNHEPKTNN